MNDCVNRVYKLTRHYDVSKGNSNPKNKNPNKNLKFSKQINKKGGQK